MIDFCRFRVVIRFFPSPPQRPMTSRLRRITMQDLIHYIIVLSYFLRKSQYFPFQCSVLDKGTTWYHFYNVFGMTRSLTGDRTREPPALEASTLPLGYRWGGGLVSLNDWVLDYSFRSKTQVHKRSIILNSKLRCWLSVQFSVRAKKHKVNHPKSYSFYKWFYYQWK